MRKAKPLYQYAVVRDTGDICTGTIERLKVNALHWLKRNAYPKGTARVARLMISEPTK